MTRVRCAVTLYGNRVLGFENDPATSIYEKRGKRVVARGCGVLGQTD